MWGLWVGFITVVVLLLSLDLGVFHRKSHTIGIREALKWTVFWGSLALGFNVLVYFIYQHHWLGIGLGEHPLRGAEAAQQFLAGYLLEFSLSVDNLFVIALIITYFRVPSLHQHRVLFWGILGALIMRGTMIGTASWLIDKIEWMVQIFGVLLIFTAFRMLKLGDEEIEPDKNPLVRFARRFYPVAPGFDGAKFFTTCEGQRAITPLFLVILVIESTDLLFAVDSIPAIFGITKDPFLVFTSNVFAIMGLRSLYFALAGMMDKFRYLKVSLVILLLFIGVKMLIARYLHIPTTASLGVIAGILAIGVIASMLATKREQQVAAALDAGEQVVSLSRVAWRQIRRVVVFVIGSSVVLIGVVMFVTPGPAVVVIPLGLLILSTEFVWAKRLLNKVKERLRRTQKEGPACAKCGYLLKSLPENGCPECGQPFEPRQA